MTPFAAIEPCADDRHVWGLPQGPSYDEHVDTWWMESRCERCLRVERWPVPADSGIVARHRLATALRDLVRTLSEATGIERLMRR
jgi:hypothetical protein